MAATISQLSCFPAIGRSLQLRKLSLQCPPLRSKLSVVMSLEGNGTDPTGADTKNTLRYTSDVPKLHVEEKQESYSTIEKQDAENTGVREAKPEQDVNLQKKSAKIHDFCLGIPFGGIVLSGGIIGFLFTRSTATLSNGVLFGGALLFLSTFSLKVWRNGKSSLPFILGQAALAGLLIWKNFQAYSLANKLFPTGFMAIISSAMLCFYLYVLLAGGNPPPKKLKTASMAS
ncbi:hypothetical protein QN277_013360 [Acacia crassicarpa]|uniref:Protein FATTY ACID EXPORT 1, chloroplastic n=1 Tax=Acacia crassicarpa TaxID=499986 RepID=A0AAE1TEL9_9FABA|nr:hypothetical protein QN277_013360 [Acacia crassicarpa]